MRILSVSNCPLDSSLGSGYVITGYVDGLRERGHEVVTLAPSDYQWMQTLRPAKRLRTLCGYSSATLRAVRQTRYDIVELWGAEAWWVARRLARRTTRPLIVARSNGLEPHFHETLGLHGLSQENSAAGAWLNRIQHLEAAFRCADALTTVSHHDRRYALAHHYQPEDRLLTLENPLPDAWLDQPLMATRPRTIGFFGSPVPNKGGDLFIRLLPSLLQAHPHWTVRLVGMEDTALSGLIPLALAARVEVISFVRNRDQLRELYRNTAVVVMPSAFESFGLVAAEAMACGCAVVASQTGFAADLKAEEEAVVVTARTTAAWLTALSDLLNDEARLTRIARGGHARVQSLRWAHAIEHLTTFYERLVAPRPR